MHNYVGNFSEHILKHCDDDNEFGIRDDDYPSSKDKCSSVWVQKTVVSVAMTN